MKLGFAGEIVIKVPSIKFYGTFENYGNQSSGNHANMCGQTDVQTDGHDEDYRHFL
jgi:hypothetical protein